MQRSAKFHGDRSSRYQDVAIFRFLKMTAVRHLGFVVRISDHPHRAFGHLCHHAKFDSNQYNSFNSMQVLKIWELGLKMPVQTPKIVFFGICPPKWGTVLLQPRKSLQCMQRRHMT